MFLSAFLVPKNGSMILRVIFLYRFLLCLGPSTKRNNEKTRQAKNEKKNAFPDAEATRSKNRKRDNALQNTTLYYFALQSSISRTHPDPRIKNTRNNVNRKRTLEKKASAT